MSEINTDSAGLERVMRDHLRLVYSAALRQTRDAHMAEDVTQAVFVLYMRKQGSISPASYASIWNAYNSTDQTSDTGARRIPAVAVVTNQFGFRDRNPR